MHSELKGVLVGCGSSATPGAAGGRPEGLTMAGFVDLDLEAARNSAAAWNAAAARLAMTWKPPCAWCSRTSSSIAPCLKPTRRHSDGAGARRTRPRREPLANNLEEARRMVEAADAAGRLFAVIQIVATQQHSSPAGLSRQRRPRSVDHRQQRLLHRRPLRRISRQHAARPAGGHGHSHLRRRPLPHGDRSAVGLLPRMESGRLMVRRRRLAVAVFQMGGGIVYTYRGSWCSEGLHTSWECEWRIIGTRGSVTWMARMASAPR